MTHRTLLALLAVFLAGCGSRFYPVRGTITLSDGKPLSKGLVIFEPIGDKPLVSARGNVRPDGKFELSTARPGDGVPPGRYKMVINPLDLSDLPDEAKILPFDVKYVNLKTTDLEFDIKPEPNDLTIKLAAGRKTR